MCECVTILTSWRLVLAGAVWEARAQGPGREAGPAASLQALLTHSDRHFSPYGPPPSRPYRLVRYYESAVFIIYYHLFPIN